MDIVFIISMKNITNIYAILSMDILWISPELFGCYDSLCYYVYVLYIYSYARLMLRNKNVEQVICESLTFSSNYSMIFHSKPI